MTETTHMRRETLEAPAAVGRLIAANAPLCRELAARLAAKPPAFAVTCARGSSDNAATYAKYLFEIRLGLVTASVGPSVRSVYGARPRMAGALFIAISQSGKSPDLLRLAEAAREDGAVTVAIVNDAASPLAEICETVLPLHAGPEVSVAATKSFIASLAAVLQLGAHMLGEASTLALLDRLPEDLAAAAEADWSIADALLLAVEHLYVVGRGLGFGIAQEAALKLKETAGLHAEAMSAAELMHGPMAIASPRFPLFALGQDDPSLPGVVELMQRLKARGVPTLGAGPAAPSADIALPLAEDLDPLVTPLATIQAFYALAERVARARGFDPDRPPHLKKVTETL